MNVHVYRPVYIECCMTNDDRVEYHLQLVQSPGYLWDSVGNPGALYAQPWHTEGRC